jgi:hypothetical protein
MKHLLSNVGADPKSTAKSAIRNLQRLAAAGLCLFFVPNALADTFNPTNAPFDELLFHVQRYGNTAERRTRKEQSREEFKRRGADSVAYLMEQSHIDNYWIRIMIDQMRRVVEDQQMAEVLVEFVNAEHEDTRKYAVYFLGFTDAPQYADRVKPLLTDEEVCGAAIRTLGKWKTLTAVPDIISFLNHDEERKRVSAANALRDIGDPRAIPHLITALGDPMFTVRNTAARALETFGKSAEKAIVKAIDDADLVPKRQMIRILGTSQSRKAARTLKTMLKDPDPGVRRDAKQSLEKLRRL